MDKSLNSLGVRNSILVWFRLDLRLEDNPALDFAVKKAIESDLDVIPVFIYAPEEESPWAPGGASKWWLAGSLRSLQADLASKGSKLLLRDGPTLKTLEKLVKDSHARAVVWNRRYEPAVTLRDTEIKAALKREGLEVETFNGSLLREPWEMKTLSGGPYQVYTAFWKAHLKKGDVEKPVRAPIEIPGPNLWPGSKRVEDFNLEPVIPWDAGMRAAWRPGEDGARAELAAFVKNAAKHYADARNIPGERGTSRLSPHLHFGEISPRRVWHEIYKKVEARGPGGGESGPVVYLKEIVWREFAYHLLFHFPSTTAEPLRPAFKKFPWASNAKNLRAWQRGLTGYPIVDAGMRELWTTGWMHNRVRMIVASFLVKHLLISWQSGAAWFWDTLVDADLASNTLGWQWVSGCGADAAPYFRVFNPVLQGEKFDAEGAYVRRWVPEIARLPKKFLHKPWEADALTLESAGVKLGATYPRPVVDHNEARDRALKSFHKIRGAKT